MNDEIKSVVKSLGRRFLIQAIRTFDRATMVVVCVCWGVAIVMIVVALYTLNLAASTRHAADTAAAAEPMLPKLERKPITALDARPLLERMQHRYPELNFALGNDQSLAISASEGTKFREWLSVLSYIDVLSPKYRWSIKEFCVGKCSNAGLMRAVLTGERIEFQPPAAAK